MRKVLFKKFALKITNPIIIIQLAIGGMVKPLAGK